MQKFKHLLGLKFSEFEDFLAIGNESEEQKEIYARSARLIPSSKKNDEMFLASVFLRSLSLIKEFRDLVFKEVGMKRSGQLYVYTEVSFPKLPIYKEVIENLKIDRIDGLAIVVTGGVITDAAIFEMKNRKFKVYSDQIESYQKVARALGIPRLVSISNQYVPKPSSYPIPVNRDKKVELYHFSWSYIITLANILLTDNDLNIKDPDQVRIMEEVVLYLKSPETGTETFDRMSKGWKQVTELSAIDECLSKEEPSITDAVNDWIQEEKDIALKLSSHLGVMVDCQKRQYKTLEQRIEGDKDSLVQNKALESVFRIKNSASPIYTKANFLKKSIRYTVKINAPLDKQSNSARFNWLMRQLKSVAAKDQEGFDSIKDHLFVSIIFKGQKSTLAVKYSYTDDIQQKIADGEVKSFELSVFFWSW